MADENEFDTFKIFLLPIMSEKTFELEISLLPRIN